MRLRTVIFVMSVLVGSFVAVQGQNESAAKVGQRSVRAVKGKVVSAKSGEGVSGAQIRIYIPDYGYLGSAMSHENGSFTFDSSEFADADKIIFSAVAKDGEPLCLELDGMNGVAGRAVKDSAGMVVDAGFRVGDVTRYSSYGELMSMMPGVTVEEGVAKLGAEPVQVYVDGYLWPLSYDKDKVVERVEEKPEMPLETSPFKGFNPYKIVVNPSNPVLYSDFRGDNMRTLKPMPSKDLVQYRLSVLEEFCPIRLVSGAVFITPEEIKSKFGVESDCGAVMLRTAVASDGGNSPFAVLTMK